MNQQNSVQLIGKVVITSDIRTVTGLRIGASSEGLKIGGVDLRVIRDPWDRPYIPGSSLKGKLRNLLERHLNVSIAVGDSKVSDHKCTDIKSYMECSVCRIFGLTLKESLDTMTLTRLIVRDVYLDEQTVKALPNMEPTLTEIKTEIMIDRRTGTTGGKGAGGLRQIERVPAGAIFRPAEFIFNIYEDGDKDLLKHLFEAMALLEDDYLGGMGSRGYGKVKFENIRVWWNKKEDYEKGNLGLTAERAVNKTWTTPRELINNFAELKKGLTG
ncbi:MAG: type III-A CRISPR-associated RAMP protein Csm3 [candidate division WOR-3 bacterium]